MPWTASDPRWQALGPYQRAAAMALLEADSADPEAARNALGAMINRAMRTGEDLGAHVSQPIYQPAIEPKQQARLERILQLPAFQELSGWAERRAQGLEPDPVQGATHFLAPERTMLALEAREPRKYRSWRNWTGFDPETGSYRDVILRDRSHAFLAPEGTYSAPFQPVDGESRVAAFAAPQLDDSRTGSFAAPGLASRTGSFAAPGLSPSFPDPAPAPMPSPGVDYAALIRAVAGNPATEPSQAVASAATSALSDGPSQSTQPKGPDPELIKSIYAEEAARRKAMWENNPLLADNPFMRAV